MAGNVKGVIYKMTQISLLNDLKTVENKLNSVLSNFMRSVYISMRINILKDLLEFQLKEFDRG